MPLEGETVLAPAEYQAIAFAAMKRRERCDSPTVLYPQKNGQMSRVFGRNWQEYFRQEYELNLLAQNILADTALCSSV